jgi:hypothetical protein
MTLKVCRTRGDYERRFTMRSKLAQSCFLGAGLLIVLLSTADPALAGVAVPEIDATSVSAGVGLLTAGVLVLRARLRR